MSEPDFNALCPDLGALPGPLRARLLALAQAGFAEVMLDVRSLTDHPGGVEVALQDVRDSGLRVAALQALRGFEGLSGPLQAHKRALAQSVLQLCERLGCRTLVVEATHLAATRSDDATLARDLGQLATLAVPRRVRIALRAHAQAATLTDTLSAWDVICAVDRSNLGLYLDAADWMAQGTTFDDLDLLSPPQVFWVQLADDLSPYAPGERLLPGEGPAREALARWVARLHTLGYCGPWGLSARSSDDGLMPLAAVVDRLRRSAAWVGQDVLRRALPLPNRLRLRRQAGA